MSARTSSNLTCLRLRRRELTSHHFRTAHLITLRRWVRPTRCSSRERRLIARQVGTQARNGWYTLGTQARSGSKHDWLPIDLLAARLKAVLALPPWRPDGQHRRE